MVEVARTMREPLSQKVVPEPPALALGPDERLSILGQKHGGGGLKECRYPEGLFIM